MSARLDASNSSLLDCIQSATRVPFDKRSTDGVSASVTNQSSPDATLTGWVQPLAARSANLRVAPSSPDSSQLTSAPFFDTLSCGPLLPRSGAGGRGWILSVHGGGA